MPFEPRPAINIEWSKVWQRVKQSMAEIERSSSILFSKVSNCLYLAWSFGIFSVVMAVTVVWNFVQCLVMALAAPWNYLSNPIHGPVTVITCPSRACVITGNFVCGNGSDRPV
jgi:hypothetical protein